MPNLNVKNTLEIPSSSSGDERLTDTTRIISSRIVPCVCFNGDRRKLNIFRNSLNAFPYKECLHTVVCGNVCTG